MISRNLLPTMQFGNGWTFVVCMIGLKPKRQNFFSLPSPQSCVRTVTLTLLTTSLTPFATILNPGCVFFLHVSVSLPYGLMQEYPGAKPEGCGICKRLYRPRISIHSMLALVFCVHPTHAIPIIDFPSRFDGDCKWWLVPR